MPQLLLLLFFLILILKSNFHAYFRLILANLMSLYFTTESRWSDAAVCVSPLSAAEHGGAAERSSGWKGTSGAGQRWDRTTVVVLLLLLLLLSRVNNAQPFVRPFVYLLHEVESSQCWRELSVPKSPQTVIMKDRTGRHYICCGF